MLTILIADGEKAVCQQMDELLCSSYKVDFVERGDLVMGRLSSFRYDLLILDLLLPGKSGMDLLSEIVKNKISVKTIVTSASTNLELAIDAMKLGVEDYLVKPVVPEKLLSAIQALELKYSGSHLERYPYGSEKNIHFESMIGRSDPVKRIQKTLSKVIDTDSTILITGESGTGKGLLARAIHKNSLRNEESFRAVDCSTIPADLIESELFGHEKGAFTGAHARKVGKFEAVGSGTLFLDEVSNLSLNVQAKLLRVLQEREFERIGGNVLQKFSARIVAATNRDLLSMVKEGRFREDLYYRLNVVPIYLPSLRERKEDIPVFVSYFLDIYNSEYFKNISLDLDAVIYLNEYRWPGNVRELENFMRRLVLLADNDLVSKDDLKKIMQSRGRDELGLGAPEDLIPPPSYGSVRILTDDGRVRSYSAIEKDVLLKALDVYDCNISKASKVLEISRKTLYNKIDKYDINIQKVIPQDEGEK